MPEPFHSLERSFPDSVTRRVMMSSLTPFREPSEKPLPYAAMSISVEVVNRQTTVRTSTAWLEKVTRKAIAVLEVEAAEITVAVVDDAEIAELHSKWMNLPDPTDVLTFDLSGCDGDFAGDIVVSAETARRVAKEVDWQAREELAYYVVHGLLHLAGFNDGTPGERRRMRRKEQEVMGAIGLPAPPSRPRKKRDAR